MTWVIWAKEIGAQKFKIVGDVLMAGMSEIEQERKRI